MDVDTYIGKYRPDWDRLDALTAGWQRSLRRRSGPELAETIRLYLRVSTHLAEVQVRYPDPALRAYLAELVTRAHAAVYSGKPRSVRGFVRLFGVRYREALRRTAPFIVAMAGLLLATTVATLVWVATSRAARAGLLPPAAQEAIRRAGGGRPDFGIGSPAVSTYILVNNVQVAILAFAFGVTLGIGTIFIVAQNGFLLGSLAGAFHAAGKGGVFWALVLPHGILELTAICISAGAGMRVGWSLIDPGDRARGQAFAEETRDALMVLIGVVPAFVVAAFVEGFVTGSPVPDIIEIGLGVALAVGYVAFLASAWPRRRSTAGRRP